jgi:hypothetical protein
MAKDRKNSKGRLQKVAATIYLEPAQADALRRLSEVTRVPQQVYLRDGVDLVLKANAKHLK